MKILRVAELAEHQQVERKALLERANKLDNEASQARAAAHEILQKAVGWGSIPTNGFNKRAIYFVQHYFVQQSEDGLHAMLVEEER